FSKELAKKDVVYLTVSRNTVDEFNQWNDENDLDLTTLSDTKHEFGKAYGLGVDIDRKSTRLNSSHVSISYAVFCLKKKILIYEPLVAQLYSNLQIRRHL